MDVSVSRARGRSRANFTWLLLVGLILVLIAPAAAHAARDPAPFVKVDAQLERSGDTARVTGQVAWDAGAVRRRPDHMSVGDLRLVAVSDRGNRPLLLRKLTYDISEGARQTVAFKITDEDELAAIRTGNRVVLTASQHGIVSPGTRTGRTYVTVGELQPFGEQQDRIGRHDCSSIPILVGAVLNRCDLVGAYLDRALVSVRAPAATRMLLADLTGATLVEADLTGLSVAGGRLNGADVSRAILDNVSLAGAYGSGLIARGATSDLAQGTAGANIFDAHLMDSDFRGAVLNGVSLDHSRLDGADFTDATWRAVIADTASFRGATLRNLNQSGSSVYFADFTDATLRGANFSTVDLAWATLCRTTMPDSSTGSSSRDCRTVRRRAARKKAGTTPLVVVDGTLDPDGPGTTVRGTVKWNATGIRNGLSAGNARAVAVDGSTGIPTVLGSVNVTSKLPATTRVAIEVTSRAGLNALQRGNRIVLTATQHPPLPSRSSERTQTSFITVDTLQSGPGRGRVGSRDCSAVPFSTAPPDAGGYELCDLVGAALEQAVLPGPLRLADLSGADLEHAAVDGIIFDGAALGGVVLKGASVGGVSMIAASAPQLTAPQTLITGGEWRAANLDRADFTGSTISDTVFAATPLRRASFSNATLDHVDLGFTHLGGAQLDEVEASRTQGTRANSLFLADLTNATLMDSTWSDDEAGDRPWQWATLCDTVMPPHAAASGDRDCPR